MDLRKLLFILVGIICVISIIFAIYSQFNIPSPSINPQNSIDTGEINEYELVNNFSNIFLNNINYQNNNVSSVSKKDYNKELVFTSYEINEQVPNKYTINAKIPCININSVMAISINNSIDSTFKNAISNIIAQSNNYTNQLYDVEYMAFVNSNILSLVIKATLKIDDSAQRVLVQTYNYNLTTNEQVKFEDILNLKGISKNYASKKIMETITKANTASQSLKDLGYTAVFVRDLNSDIYNIDNTSVYFLGENGVLYVIYPYGNNNTTSEMDVIVF